MAPDKHERLAAEANRLKRAWLLAAAIMGIGKQLTPVEYLIPNYLAQDNKWLKRHIEDLEDDFDDLAKRMLRSWKRASLPLISSWMAQKYDSWQAAGCAIYEI